MLQTGLTNDSPVASNGRGNALDRLLSTKSRHVFTGMYENLLTSDATSRPKVVLVCSASDGEGATTVASGLAIAAVEHGSGSVLLLDCNYRKPGISQVFGSATTCRSSKAEPEGIQRYRDIPLSGALGLSDVLRGAPACQAIMTVSFDIPKANGAKPTGASVSNGEMLNEIDMQRQGSMISLNLMGTGKNLKNHVQSFDPPRFRNLLDELLKLHTFIVVDGPPVNAFPESMLLASQVDCVLFVVQAGVTRSPVASKALTKLTAMGSAKIEVVLNRRVFAIPQAIYKRL